MKISSFYKFFFPLITIVVVVIVLTAFAEINFAQTTTTTMYSITQLGTLGGESSSASGINNFGQVVGSSQISLNSFVTHAFRTAPNSPINPVTDNLGTFGGPSSYADDINDLGQVIGTSDIATLVPQTDYHKARIFRTAPNKSINAVTDDLGNLNTLFPSTRGINNLGQVVGSLTSDVPQDPSSKVRAFRTAANKRINATTDILGTLVGDLTIANDINNLGQVVGYSSIAVSAGNPDGSLVHAFRTAANKRINPTTDDLGTLGGKFSFANSINKSGRVVGGSQLSLNSSIIRAFRTAANQKINPATDNLGTLGGNFSVAYGINDSGQVVGASSLLGQPSFKTRAFLYQNGKMFNLNSRIPTNSGFTLTAANDINNNGQIAATGYINSSGAIRAFLLTPAL